MKTQTKEIEMNQTCEFDLGYFGDEEGARIHKQAQHFLTSEIDREPETAKYIYTPAKNYKGQDEVEIIIETGSDGAGPGKEEMLILKFIIS